MRRFNLFKICVAFVVTSLFLTSCSEEDVSVANEFSERNIIVNAGAFLSTPGDFTSFSNLDGADQEIFKTTNGFSTGGFIQSTTVSDGKVYALINVSGNVDGKIQVIDRNSFQSIVTVDEDSIFAPRFLRVAGSKAYFTDLGRDAYGATPGTSSVSVLDLNTYKIEKRIEIPRLPADIAIVGSNAYAAIDGYYDGQAMASVPDSTLQIIDLNSESVTGKIVVKKNPYAIAKGEDNTLWVLCQEGFIVKVNTSDNTVESSIPASGIGFDVKYTWDETKEKLYYIASQWVPGPNDGDPFVNITGVNVLDIKTEKVTSTDISLASASGISFNDDKLYIGESKEGKMYVYSLDGTQLSSFQSGVFPNNILFAE